MQRDQDKPKLGHNTHRIATKYVLLIRSLAFDSARRSSLHRQGDERHIQNISEACWLVSELHLTVQLLSERPHHAGAEALPAWHVDRRPIPFGPGQPDILLVIDRPANFHMPAGHGERAELRGVRAQFVECHGESDHGA